MKTVAFVFDVFLFLRKPHRIEPITSTQHSAKEDTSRIINLKTEKNFSKQFLNSQENVSGRKLFVKAGSTHIEHTERKLFEMSFPIG